jgi:hypothetical protein
MKERVQMRSLSTVAALLVLAVFAVGILSVLLGGVNAYTRLTQRDQAAYESRSAAQYLATRLRQISGSEAVSVAPFGEGQALVIADEVDGDMYLTRIYCYNGWLMELYSAPGGAVARSAEVNLSQPVTQLKRIMTGSLHDGERAVFVASIVDESTIVTDVYALVNGVLTNVSMSNESGTSVKTVRNYYVYAEDIDGDGVLELPSLISMRAPTLERSGEREHLIRWYSLAADGSEHDKRFTYHNYLQGWYMELDADLVDRLCVVPEDTGRFAFCLWDRGYRELSKLWTVYVLTGDDRSSIAAEGGRFQLMKTDSVVYAAYLEEAAMKLGITQEDLTNSFFLIQSDWKTGEM